MAGLRFHPPISIITNYVTVKYDNNVSFTASNSLYFVQPQCLVITQYVNKSGWNFIYNIYIINNIECDINNITLMGVLPKYVNFVFTSVEHGVYRYCKDNPNKIFYYISIIKAHSFCKIIVNTYTRILGVEMKPIEILDIKI